MTAQPIYSLAFVTAPDATGVIVAELFSPMLDSILHPTGSVAVEFASAGKATDGSQFVLNSFHVNSLLEYLRSQPLIRQVLESELPRDQERWDPEGEPVRGDLWSWVEVRSLRLRPREVPTDETTLMWRKNLGLSNTEVRNAVAASDKPETATFFEVALDCDWDSDHDIIASFRDGAFVELDHA